MRSWALSQAGDAFRFMAAARHVGKLALRTSGAPIRGTWLVAGGTGALGGHIARWLARRGAQRLVLLSRRGPDAPGVDALSHELAELGAEVVVVAVDLGEREQVRSAVRGLDVHGVVYAAGVLDDGVLATVDTDRLHAVWTAKVTGAQHLIDALGDAAGSLQALVLFSSAAGTLGAPGQGIYGAANAGLDALAARLRSDGVPAISVAWGPWADGMGGGRAGPGVRPWSIEAGLSRFEAALDAADPVWVAADVDLTTLRGTPPPLWSNLLTARGAVPATSWVYRLRGLPDAARRERVHAMVHEVVAATLARSTPAPSDRPLTELGMDSLQAVDLRNVLGARIERPLPATLAFDHPTVDALTDRVLEALGYRDEAPAAPFMASKEHSGDGAIAVVAMACRFPGAHSPEAFWELLQAGRDAITPVPADRWDVNAWYDPTPATPGRTTSRAGGFIEGLDRFDAAAFRISGAEARAMDPQQRMLLTVCSEAIERSGRPVASRNGSATGVFVGIGQAEYGERFALGDPGVTYAVSGSDPAFAAGRVAYALGLTGPAMAVNTMCSSSLVAVHLAVRALRDGDCDLALAGGAHALVSPRSSVLLSQTGALSPSDRCRAFAADADGYVRGEGCGIVALRRLADAERDGDPILGVIRGTAVNQAGGRAGLVVPSGPSQQAVIAAALADAGAAPSDISVLECHGTGTRLGDPIEAEAAGRALCRDRDADAPLWIGSVKSNIGHLEAAAGVAGLMKLLLALRHRELPRTLHAGVPNPDLPLDRYPMAIANRAQPLASAGPVLGAVSSFGLSGTNAHAIVEGPASRVSSVERSALTRPLWLSARDADGLQQAAHELAGALQAGTDLDDAAHTLAVARTARPVRAAWVVTDRADAIAQLRAAVSPVTAQQAPAVAWLFTGQGSQYPGMADALADHLVFRDALDRCAVVLDPLLPTPLRQALASDAVHHTALTQPALFALEWSLAQVLLEVCPPPRAVGGHSLGELVAATVAGALPIDQALQLVAHRARLMGALPAGGAMLGVFGDATEVTARVSEVDLAAVNGPHEVVLSGTVDAIADAQSILEGRGLRCRRLTVSHAFHSRLMDPVLDPFEALATKLDWTTPHLDVLSAVTGTLERQAIADPAYWRRHLRAPVRFADAVQTLVATDIGVISEVGPRAMLGPMIARAGVTVPVVPVLDPKSPDRLVEAMGELWCHGVPVSAAQWAPGGRVELPVPPLQKTRHWVPLPTAPSAGVMHVPSWVDHVVPTPSRRSEVVWLIGGDVDLLAHCLIDAGAHVLRAIEGVALPAAVTVVVVADDPEASLEDRFWTPARACTSIGTRRLCLVSRRAQSVDGDDIDPGARVMWGLGRAFARERPDLDLRLVDLDVPDAGIAAVVLGDSGPAECAVRDGRIRVPELAPFSAAPSAAPPVEPDRMHIVTGGLGALGLTFARWLADRGARHLLLLGRSAPNAEAIAAVAALAARDVDVDVRQLDISDAAAVDAMVTPPAAARGLGAARRGDHRRRAARVADRGPGAPGVGRQGRGHPGTARRAA